MTIQIHNNLHTFYDVPSSLSKENIIITGRTETIGNEIMFDWPNVSLHCHLPKGITEFYFRGEGINLLKIEIENNKDIHIVNPSLTIAKQLQQNTICFKSCFCILSISNPTETSQSMTITKISEARDGAVSFYGVNRQLEECQCECRKNRKKIEIIGDSLSCGYGMFPIRNETSVPLQSDASNSYTSLLSKQFNLENHTIAWSGMGLVRNYEDILFPNDEKNIMKLWQKKSAGNDELDYEFDYQPDYVMVNIGHNDFWDVGMQNPFRDDLPEAYFGEEVNDNETEDTEEVEIIERSKDDWKVKHSLGETIIDDFILNDTSELDFEFEKKGIALLTLILEKYPKLQKLFIVIGPFLPREGEQAWRKVIEKMNTIDNQHRCIELNCQLCCDINRKELWGYRRHPSCLAHQLMTETLSPQLHHYLQEQ